MSPQSSPDERPDAQARAEAAAMRIPDLANADPDIQRRARWLTAEWLLGAGETQFHVTQREGRIEGFQRGPFLMRPWTFAIRADAPAWLEFWRPLPAPGFHDILALSKHGRLRIEGDLHPFMANLQVIKDIVTTPRARP